MMTSNCWSALPPEAYSVQTGIGRVGPADLPHYQLPGVWNILWLFTKDVMDTQANFEGDPQDFSLDFAGGPMIVATALQMVEGKTLGQWAEELSPTLWIEKARKVELFIEAVWPHALEVAAENARNCRPRKSGNLIVVDFAGRKRS